MIQSSLNRKSNAACQVKRADDQKAYAAVNAIFAGVILIIMGYSGFYSPDESNYPVPCVHEKITGEPCPSCGMSHAFSLIVRGRIDEAIVLNRASTGVFLFFAVQLIFRILLGARTMMTGNGLKKIVIADSLISALMALAAFYPFLRSLWLRLF